MAGLRKRGSDPDAGAAADAVLAAEMAMTVPSGRKTKAEPAKAQAWRGLTLGGVATNLFTLAMVGYACMVGRNIYGILQPTFPDAHPNGVAIPKIANAIEPGALLHARVWAGPEVPAATNRKPPQGTPPSWEFDFPYGYAHGFESQSKTMGVTIPEGLLSRRGNVHIYAEVARLDPAGDYERAPVFASSTGQFVKFSNPPEVIPKWKLLSGEQCSEHVERTYGKKEEVARGMPMLQIRLVFDEMVYPPYYIGSNRPYHPQLFVDEFWMSDDQLIKLNTSDNSFDAAVSFDLMSSGRWRFQRQMEQSFKVSFQRKNPDFLIRNPDFLLKNVEFLIKCRSTRSSSAKTPRRCCKCVIYSRTRTRIS